MPDQVAIGIERQQRVVEGPVARSVLDPFVDADDHDHAELARRAPDLVGHRPWDDDAVGPHACKEPLRRFMPPQRGVRTMIQPDWVPGQPGLAEGDESHAVARGPLEQLQTLAHAAVEVEIDRHRLDDRDTNAFRLRHAILTIPRPSRYRPPRDRG